MHKKDFEKRRRFDDQVISCMINVLNIADNKKSFQLSNNVSIFKNNNFLLSKL